MSLAERAAAARKARAAKAASRELPPLTPEQRGSVQGSQYVNPFFHFRIEMEGEWEPITAEHKAESQAAAREIESSTGLRAGAEENRPLWMDSPTGESVILSVHKLPPDAPTDQEQVIEAFKRVAFPAQVAAKITREPILIGDARHRFSAFRVSYTVRGVQLASGVQMILIDGYLLNFTITARSDEQVEKTLQALKSRMTWTDATAGENAGPQKVH